MNRFNGQAGAGGQILLSPGEAARGQYTALGYRAAKVQRRAAGQHPTAGSGDFHLRQDRLLLGQIADRFMRDNGIYKGILNRFVDAVYGANGFLLDVSTKNKALDKKVKERWARFSEDPEVRGLFAWADAERLALTTLANQGDVGAVHTTRRKFQFVESEEIGGRARLSRSSGKKGERWESGVLLDSVGRPIAYRLHARSNQGQIKSGKGKRIAAKNFTFCANRERFSQTRGVPILVSTFAMVHRISDVIDSEAAAWQNLSKFALSITRENSAEQAYTESSPDDDGVDAPPDMANRVVELEEALIFYANKGEEIKGIDRTLPGKDFPESIRMFLRLIGLPIGLPLEVILLDYSNTSYSSARASLEQAYRMFVVWQSFLKRSWHTPLYRRWLGWEIQAKTLPAHPRLVADAAGEGAAHSWIAPEFPWVDHLKEAEAWGMRMDRGLATQAMALKTINLDHDEWLETRCEEVQKAIECADAVNKANPKANVDWRMFAAIPVSKTQGIAAVEQGTPTPAPAKPSPQQQVAAAAQVVDFASAVRQVLEETPQVLPEDPTMPNDPRIIVPPLEIIVKPEINVTVDAVNAGEVNAGMVNAGMVSAGDVVAGDVKAGDVQAGAVEAGAVTAGDVNAGAVSAGAVEAGPVTAGPTTVENVTVEAPVTVNIPKRSRSIRVEREGGSHGPIQRIVEEG